MMMQKPTLVLTVGLPRSGKSTWARKQGCPVVNPDSIRLALHGQRYVPEAEPMVWAMAMYMVKALFLAGHKYVILDATNINPHRRRDWCLPEWFVVLRIFRESVSECQRRAIQCGQHDLVPVIARMASEWSDEDMADYPQFAGNVHASPLIHATT